MSKLWLKDNRIMLLDGSLVACDECPPCASSGTSTVGSCLESIFGENPVPSTLTLHLTPDSCAGGSPDGTGSVHHVDGNHDPATWWVNDVGSDPAVCPHGLITLGIGCFSNQLYLTAGVQCRDPASCAICNHGCNSFLPIVISSVAPFVATSLIAFGCGFAACFDCVCDYLCPCHQWAVDITE